MCFVVFVAISNTVTVATTVENGKWRVRIPHQIFSISPLKNAFLFRSRKCCRSGSDGLFLGPGGIKYWGGVGTALSSGGTHKVLGGPRA